MTGRDQLFFDFLEVILRESVLASAGAGEAFGKPFPALADPADLTGGDPGHQSVILYVAGDNGTCRYEGAAADGVAADNRAVGPQRRALAHARTRIHSVHGKVCAWRIHVGEHARGAAENVVLQFNALVHRYIVLYTDTVSYANVVANVHVLPQRAVRTYYGTFLDMAEVPYLGAGAYAGAVVNIAALVYEPVLHYSTSMLSRGATAFITFFVSNIALACCCTKA